VTCTGRSPCWHWPWRGSTGSRSAAPARCWPAGSSHGPPRTPACSPARSMASRLDGLQSGLPRGSDQRPPGVHRPPPPAIERATVIYRQLAAGQLAAFARDLGSSLNNQSDRRPVLWSATIIRWLPSWGDLIRARREGGRGPCVTVLRMPQTGGRCGSPARRAVGPGSPPRPAIGPCPAFSPCLIMGACSSSGWTVPSV
jgi:hypothetical protein